MQNSTKKISDTPYQKYTTQPIHEEVTLSLVTMHRCILLKSKGPNNCTLTNMKLNYAFNIQHNSEILTKTQLNIIYSKFKSIGKF